MEHDNTLKLTAIERTLLIDLKPCKMYRDSLRWNVQFTTLHLFKEHQFVPFHSGEHLSQSKRKMLSFKVAVVYSTTLSSQLCSTNLQFVN